MNRKGYEINYITNTITVSKKFLEQASTLGGDTYETMKALRKLGMPIVLEKMKKRNPRLNIIFVTVCSESEHAKAVMRLKPSGYLTKEATIAQIQEELLNLR